MSASLPENVGIERNEGQEVSAVPNTRKETHYIYLQATSFQCFFFFFFQLPDMIKFSIGPIMSAWRRLRIVLSASPLAYVYSCSVHRIMTKWTFCPMALWNIRSSMISPRLPWYNNKIILQALKETNKVNNLWKSYLFEFSVAAACVTLIIVPSQVGVRDAPWASKHHKPFQQLLLFPFHDSRLPGLHPHILFFNSQRTSVGFSSLSCPYLRSPPRTRLLPLPPFASTLSAHHPPAPSPPLPLYFLCALVFRSVPLGLSEESVSVCSRLEPPPAIRAVRIASFNSFFLSLAPPASPAHPNLQPPLIPTYLFLSSAAHLPFLRLCGARISGVCCSASPWVQSVLTDFIRAVIQPACLIVCLDKSHRAAVHPGHHDTAWRKTSRRGGRGAVEKNEEEIKNPQHENSILKRKPKQPWNGNTLRATALCNRNKWRNCVIRPPKPNYSAATSQHDLHKGRTAPSQCFSWILAKRRWHLGGHFDVRWSRIC